MAELLEWLARRLVDEPDAVRVETEQREDAIVFHLHVAPDDVGKVIGKQGRIAAGSGTSIEDVNRLLQARKQMEKMMKAMGKGKMPTLPPELTGASRAKRGRR